MKIPELKLGNIVARLPVVQGGMAVRVSTAPLVSAVAETGGIGLIGASGMELDEVRDEIRRAKAATEGIVGINIMVATRNFADTVRLAVRENVDLIVAGAGFSRKIFKIGSEAGIPILPIVSSARLAKIAEKLGASGVIVEGKEAGGHLGTDRPLRTILRRVIDKVRLPVIAAGGIRDGEDIAEFLRMGASGVQMGTRFVATDECAVAQEFKEMYVNAKTEDVVLVESPVGMPGRALKNSFVERLNRGEIEKASWCRHLCLKKCSRRYCIINVLMQAQQGDVENGLVFAGETVGSIREILPVRKIMRRLTSEIRSALSRTDENNEEVSSARSLSG